MKILQLLGVRLMGCWIFHMERGGPCWGVGCTGEICHDMCDMTMLCHAGTGVMWG